MSRIQRAVQLYRENEFIIFILKLSSFLSSCISLGFSIVAFYLITIVSLLVGRDKRRLAFANVAQDDFSDNTKYLFLHLNTSDYNSIRPVWITKNPDVKRNLEEKGFDVYLEHSLAGIIQLLRAGFIFFDGSMRGYKWYYTGGATRLQLRHGIPLKGAPRNRGGLFKSIMNRLVEKYDFVITASKTDRDHCIRYYQQMDHWLEYLKPSFETAVPIETGFPRTDVLLRDVKSKRIGVPPEIKTMFESVRGYDYVIGYFPTYRQRDSITPFTDNYLIEYLNEIDGALLVRSHRLVSTDLPDSDKVFELPSYGDIYPLLNEIDVLITDYSSIALDFSLTGKPVLFYTFDRDQYSDERGVHRDFDQITAGHRVLTEAELVTEVERAISGEAASNEQLLQFFADIDGRASERLAKFVLDEQLGEYETY